MPSNIILRNLSTPPVKGLTSPFISTKPEFRDGSRPADPVPPTSGDGAIIFEADWANQAEWSTIQRSEGYTFPGDDGDGVVTNDNLPPWVSFYYTSEYWDHDTYGLRPVAEVSAHAGSPDDPNGKSFIFWDSPYDRSGGQWGIDADMLWETDVCYKDAFIDCMIRFDPNYIWKAKETGSGQTSVKMFRMRYYTGGDTGQRFGQSLDVDASLVMNLVASGGIGVGEAEAKFGYNYKHYPGETNKQEYNLDIVPDSEGENVRIEEIFADGNWHRVRVRALWNSAAGVADGKYQIAVDDRLCFDRDVAWQLTEEAPADAGFNQFGWGGNSYNDYHGHPDDVTDPSAVFQHYIAFHGFKVHDGVPSDSAALFGES